MKLKFKIALVNVFWSENDINTRFFESVEDQTAYFDELTRGKFSDLVNFNMGNNIETAVTYLDKSGRSVSELVSCNYAVVQEVDEEGSFVKNRYFFAYPSQDSNNQMRVTLSLDDIQTNYFPYKNKIAPCLIRRANLNRFVDNGDDTYSFNGQDNSPLYIDELNSIGSKRLVNRYSLQWDFTPNYADLNEWLNENVAYWVYVFADKTHNFTGYTQGGTQNSNISGIYYRSEIRQVTGGESIKTDYAVFCYPIFKKTTSQIKITYGSLNYNLSSSSQVTFEANNSGTSYIYTKKISIKPPFRHISSSRYTISGNTLTINLSTDYDPGIANPNLPGEDCRIFFADTNKCLLGGNVQYKDPIESLEIDLSNEFPLTFTKQQIIQGGNSKELNPKSRSFENVTLRLKSFDGSIFDYDLQKLNSNKFKFLYSEVIQAEITKYYVRIVPSGLYVEESKNSLLGIVGSSDMTFSISNDQWDSYLANNKNFWLQSSFKLFGESAETIGHSAVAGSKLGIAGGIASAGVNIISSLFDKAMTIDNMKEAPDSLKQSAGNPLFLINIIPMTIFVEIHKVLDCVLENKNDFNKLYGYVYDRIDNLSNVDNIRQSYNYIEADVENISAPISNLEKERLKQKLKSIRFWNDDVIQYQTNIERGIEDA